MRRRRRDSLNTIVIVVVVIVVVNSHGDITYRIGSSSSYELCLFTILLEVMDEMSTRLDSTAHGCTKCIGSRKKFLLKRFNARSLYFGK